MKFSTRTRYGIRAMLDLAYHFKGSPVLVKEIAERQKISEKYLEHIMLELKKAGFVQSISGAKGGYILAKDPSEIKLSELVEVLEGTLAPVMCVDHKSLCLKGDRCAVREVWVKVREGIKKVLDSITLNDLVKKEKERRENILMYQI
ncbi:Rrf2 family transcriptional regulator [bacterium]|nr:Rrf2 family transcriptional regulator [bacterium]